jgi:hypothetical protein
MQYAIKVACRFESIEDTNHTVYDSEKEHVKIKGIYFKVEIILEHREVGVFYTHKKLK